MQKIFLTLLRVWIASVFLSISLKLSDFLHFLSQSLYLYANYRILFFLHLTIFSYSFTTVIEPSQFLTLSNVKFNRTINQWFGKFMFNFIVTFSSIFLSFFGCCIYMDVILVILVSIFYYIDLIGHYIKPNWNLVLCFLRTL